MQYAGGPLPDDRPVLSTYLRSFTVSLGELSTHTPPVAQVTGIRTLIGLRMEPQR